MDATAPGEGISAATSAGCILGSLTGHVASASGEGLSAATSAGCILGGLTGHVASATGEGLSAATSAGSNTCSLTGHIATATGEGLAAATSAGCIRGSLTGHIATATGEGLFAATSAGCNLQFDRAHRHCNKRGLRLNRGGPLHCNSSELQSRAAWNGTPPLQQKRASSPQQLQAAIGCSLVGHIATA